MNGNIGYKIVAFWGCESNPYANSATANNGGGYSQPSGGVSARLEDGREVIVEYDDLSCGDFGTRIRVEIDAGELIWYLCYGTMADAMCCSDEEVDACLASVSGCLGIDAWALLADVEYLVSQAAYC